MALPRISIEVDANVVDALGGLDAVEDKLIRLGSQARRTGARIGRGSAFGRGIQNASYQMGDFAVQVGAGTSASIALGQQLPQLIQGFGVWGAVLGAAVAIAVPLTRVLGRMSDEGRDLTSVFGTMQPVLSAIGDVFEKIKVIGIEAAELIINNMDRLLAIAIAVSAVFAGRMVASFVAARIATFSLVGALTALRVAIIRTGIGALVIAAGELVYQFSRLATAAGGVAQAIGLIAVVALEVLQRVGRGFSLMGELMAGMAMSLEGSFISAWDNIKAGFASMINVVVDGWNKVREMAGAQPLPRMDENPSDGRGARLEAAGTAVVNSAAASIFDLATSPLESVQTLKDLLKSIKDENLDIPSLLSGTSGEDDEDGSGKGKSAWDLAIEKIQQTRKAYEGLRSAQQAVWGEAANLIQQFAGKSKIAAIAAIAIQKGLSIAQIISNSAAAQLRALAELGPVAGPPVAAKIATYGKIQAALVAATGLAQAASAGGGGGGAGGLNSVGPQNGGGGQQPAAPAQQRSVTLIGERFNRKQVIEMAEFMNDGTDDGLVIRGRR